MSTKGFFLLVMTVMVIGGSIGGAFSGGLALGRSQSDDAAPETAFLQQRFGAGQVTSDGFTGGRLPGSGLTGGGSPGGQLGGVTSGGLQIRPEGESSTGQDGATGLRGGPFGGRGGFGGIVGGTVVSVDGAAFTVSTDSGETTVTLDDDSLIQLTRTGTADDLSAGDRVFVIATGAVESGEPVVAASVMVNSPEVGRLGDGGFGGILNGIIAAVDGDVFTVTTDSGETTVTLADDSAIQVYEVGTVDDLSPGDRVLVVLSGNAETGEPVTAASVIVNAPQGGGIFGGGGFRGRQRGP